MLNIRRVSRTVSGGRRFSFSVALVAGNKKGMVGVGLGKAGDTALAIDKAFRDAKKNMVKVNVTKDMSIPHEVFEKYSSARVSIRPVKDRGLVAGSSARTVLELAGISNVAAKIISPSKNKLNIARATIAALKSLTLVRPTPSAKAK
jgi:small subunit ribosomal protein S5